MSHGGQPQYNQGGRMPPQPNYGAPQQQGGYTQYGGPGAQQPTQYGGPGAQPPTQYGGPGAQQPTQYGGPGAQPTQYGGPGAPPPGAGGPGGPPQYTQHMQQQQLQQQQMRQQLQQQQQELQQQQQQLHQQQQQLHHQQQHMQQQHLHIQHQPQQMYQQNDLPPGVQRPGPGGPPGMMPPGMAPPNMPPGAPVGMPQPGPAGRGALMGYPPGVVPPPGGMPIGMPIPLPPGVALPPGVIPMMRPGLPYGPGMPVPGMPNLNPPTPPQSPDEEERDPRLDDPWLIEFTKKAKEAANDQDSEWAVHKVKARVREISQTIEKLKILSTQMKELQEKNPKSIQLKPLVEQIKTNKDRLEELFTIFRDDEAAYKRFKAKLHKNRKHKVWLQKSRERVKKEKADKPQKIALLNRLIDEWQTKLITKDMIRRKAEDDRKQRKAEDKRKQLAKKEATHLHDVLIKLEELRALRAQTLELEGQQVSSSSLYDVLQQYLKEHPIEEDKKEKELEDMLDKLEEEDGIVIGTELEEDKEKEKEKEKERKEKEEKEKEKEKEGEKKPGEQKAITEDDVRKYYEQAYESVDRLIAVRRAWDQFIVPAGYGTRIPPTFLTTPPPSSKEWRKYLKRPKRASSKNNNKNADKPASDKTAK